MTRFSAISCSGRSRAARLRASSWARPSIRSGAGRLKGSSTTASSAYSSAIADQFWLAIVCSWRWKTSRGDGMVGCDDTAEPLHVIIGAVTPDTQYGVAAPVVKRLRADARRNRDRLLAVAEDIFARRGLVASTDDIARAAGVGIGTLFRHFPTKEALLEAVFVARLQHLTEDARRLSSGDDPGEAFATFFAQIITESRTKLPLATAL